MTVTVEPVDAPLGALVKGVDLSAPLDGIDGIHVAPGRLAVAGRRHLAGVHIQRQRDIAQAGEFGGHRLDLIVQAPPFVNQQDGGGRGLRRQGQGT